MDNDQDKFKESFKYFKSRNPPPDLSKVIDFDLHNSQQIIDITAKCPTKFPRVEGMVPVESWKVYQLANLSGFYFIRNPFEPSGQRYWAYRCLRELPDKPSVCNLDAHVTRTENIWDSSSFQKKSKAGEKTLMDKLRWVTLGYHHNWDTKVYDVAEHAPFPVDLGYLSSYIVAALQPEKRYRAEAAIVNYYHMDSTLAGHTDHSEFDLEAPLISVSFGQPAIFLLGGTTKATEPVAMFLRSGDVVVMSGQSRLAYHAVPRVISEPSCALSPWLQEDINNSESGTDRHGQDTGQIREAHAQSMELGNENVCQAGTGLYLEPARKIQRTEGMTMISRTPDSEVRSGEVCCSTGEPSCLENISNDLLEATDKMCDHARKRNHHIKHKLNDVDFTPFSRYLETSRININVRQVFKLDESSGSSVEHTCAQTKMSDR